MPVWHKIEVITGVLKERCSDNTHPEVSIWPADKRELLHVSKVKSFVFLGYYLAISWDFFGFVVKSKYQVCGENA